MPANNLPRWTEIELLPEWEEEFYDVYTAKKFGKWVMLKTLKAQYRDDPKYQAMIEKEFDVRYNLANPNIIMINDFEDVPGIGRCIITDDVYGDSLRKLIDKKQVDEKILKKVTHQLVDAIDYIQTNHIVHHPIRPETIIFTENIRNLKVIDVGFDQHSSLTAAAASDDIYNYGLVLREVLEAMPDADPHLRKVMERCTQPNPKHRFRDVQDLKLAISGDSNRGLYLIIITFLFIMTILLAWLVTHPAS